MVQLMPLPSSLFSFKSRLVLRFWYQLTRVVLEKRPLNGCGGGGGGEGGQLIGSFAFSTALALLVVLTAIVSSIERVCELLV